MTEQEESRDTLAREEAGLTEPETSGAIESPELSEPAQAPEQIEAEGPTPAAGAAAAEAVATESVSEAAADEPAEPVATEPEPAPAAETSGEEAAPGGPRRKRWYVVHTYSGHENKVKANMERAIQYARLQERFGEILVATEDYAVMKAGKKQITKRKTFPSYVLVEMAMDDESRALVQNIPGVTHFVGDKNPTALTEAEVRRIRGEEVREVGKVTTEVPFKVGESVKVTQGPFADFVGSVDEINLERGKLRVMVSIFGRATAVELDLTHVTSI